MSEKGDLRVNLSGNQSGFQAMLSNAKQTATKFSHEVGQSWSSGLVRSGIGGLIGMFGFEALKSSFESFISRATEIKHLSEQLEMSAESTQKWAKAAEAVGVEFGTIQQVLEAIQQKRIDALTDPKAASLFEQLGIPRKDILTEGKDIRQAVMLAGLQSEEKRNIVGEIVGRRGLKSLPAATVFDQATAQFGPEALKAAEEAHSAGKRISAFFGRAVGDAASAFAYLKDLMTDNPQGRKSQWFPKGELRGTQRERMAAGAYGADIGAIVETVKDPLQSLKRDLEIERQNSIDAAQESQRAQERRLLAPGQSRISLMQELLRTRRKIEDEEMRKAPDTLKTDEEKRDWEAKHEERLAGLRGKLAGYQYDLRERPIMMGADALAKSGLFGASSLNTINGTVDIGKQQLYELREIKHAVRAGKKDPAKL
jgi:hypothetical protein